MVAVTWPLVGEYVALQPEVMVCPDARANLSDQPLMAVEPVLVMVMLSVRPVLHALTELVTRQVPVPLCEPDELELEVVVGVGELDEVTDEVLPPDPSLTVMLELPLLW